MNSQRTVVSGAALMATGAMLWSYYSTKKGPGREGEELEPEPVLRVLGVQCANVDATSDAERDANVAAAVAAIKQHPGYDVYVLPEMSSVGYGGDAWLRSVAALAEDAETGPSRRAFGALAKDMKAVIVYGFPRLDDDGSEEQEQERRPTISQTVIGPDGARVATYDKLHLCGFGDCSEGSVFRRGDHLTAFTVRARGHLFRVGLLICCECFLFIHNHTETKTQNCIILLISFARDPRYARSPDTDDLRFPDVWGRLSRDAECDVILHPSCFPNDGSFATWHTFVKTRAVENQCYVLSLSRAHPHFGKSIAVGPAPSTVAASRTLGTDEAVLPLTVSRRELDSVRAEYGFRADRRGDYDYATLPMGGI
jgi:predicted amidohydrolase